jgi:hypothetical protein
MVPVDSNGQFNIQNTGGYGPLGGSVDVLVDVLGYYQ